MTELPGVSFITTAYNAERFLRAAIDSVLGQMDVQIEHVIVDDGSADATADVAARAAAADARVRVIRAGRIGRGRALNLAIEQCRFPLIAILDADDLAHPRRAALLAGVLATHSDAALAGSGQILFGNEESPRWVTVDAVAAHSVNASLPYYNPLSHSSVIVRRESLARVGGYDDTRRSLFDWDLYVRLAAAGHPLLKVDVPLVAKRIHPEQYFEGRRKVAYAAACLKLQWRAASDLRGGLAARLAAPVALGYRLLPRPVRLAVRRIAAAARDRGAPR